MLRHVYNRSINSIKSLGCTNYSHAAFKPKLDLKHGKFSVGSIYHGFLCTDVQEVKEFNMTAITFKHERTKTDYLHLQRDDQNNVFSINFRTTPFNSSGLPHILEHTVLCGSKLYPVRDPFFKMLNRSLATFMNALTAPDYTMYPFSSQNEADYRNLQKIYLDAVFRPNLNKLDFLQEGWRLEYSDVNNPKSDLGFKGVVFNEMKGAFSENSALFGQSLLNTILPDHTYGYISGGDPLHIPNLTVEELRAFHKKYYHPSNCRIYSYGNFPVERNLEICDRLYLSNYEGIDSSYSRVPPQPRWSAPVEKQIYSRHDKMGAPFDIQNQIAIGYLMTDVTDVYETFVLQFLSELMVLGPNSQFYKSLIEPNISGGYNSTTGYDAQLRDTLFVVGLQDIERNKFNTVKEIFDDTLHTIIKNGFEKTHIESVLHGIELGIKHQTTKFGINALFNISPLWNHDGQIMDALQVVRFLNRFKENIRDPNYLQERVEHYFMKNNHKLTLTMIPDESYGDNLNKMEDELLKLKISQLTDDDRRVVFEDGKLLSEMQKAKADTDVLPCLKLDDIPKDIKHVHFVNKNLKTIPAQICEANTNDITYFKAILDTSHFDDRIKFLIPIFNAIAPKMNMKNYTYREFDQLINLKTGGVHSSSHVADRIDVSGKFEQGVMISSHCLDRNVGDMLAIWSEIFGKPEFNDVERFKMLLDNYVSGLSTNVASSGHMYAMQCANSLVSTSSLLRENLSGMRHIELVKKIVKEKSTGEIMGLISEIADGVYDDSNIRIAVNLSRTNKNAIVDRFEEFCASIQSDKNEMRLSDNERFDKATECMHYMNNFAVNYCAKSVVTVPFIHGDFAKLTVLARYLSSKYLHPIIREQNGAYGGGANLANSGLFSFYSYRDPNARVTLDVFDDAAIWMKNNPAILDDQALFEAKLGVLQKLDAPVAECNKGIDYFTSGLGNDVLQKHRRDILNVTKEDLIGVCEQYLSNDHGKSTIGKCVIGPGENAESGKTLPKDNENWKIIKPSDDA